MDLNHIRIFVDVMNTGSFAAAAKLRNVDPSSVSRAIASLETRLQFKLFQRNSRVIASTQAGRAYFDRVEDLLHEFDLAGEQSLEMLGQVTGKIRIAASTSFGQKVLGPLMPSIRKLHPALIIELVLHDQQVNLHEEQIDLAIRFGSEPVGDVTSTLLMARKFNVCASPTYLEMHRRIQHPADLAEHDCVLFPMAGYRSTWLFRDARHKIQKVNIKGQLIVSHGLTVTACAIAGVGPALLPSWLCKTEIEEGKLVDLFPKLECATRDFDSAGWLVRPGSDRLPKKVEVLINILKSNVKHF